MKKEKTLYLCDPQKNKECEKSSCQIRCKFTTKKEFAKINDETFQSVEDALIDLAKAVKELLFEFLYSYEPFRKHLHYAVYAKKERVRKKHFNIMLKLLEKR